MSLTAHEPPVEPDAVPWHPLDDPGPLDGWVYEARSHEWVRYSTGTVIARLAAEAHDAVAHVVDLPDELSPRPRYGVRIEAGRWAFPVALPPRQ